MTNVGQHFACWGCAREAISVQFILVASAMLYYGTIPLENHDG